MRIKIKSYTFMFLTLSASSLVASLFFSSLFKEWLIFYLSAPFAVSLFFLMLLNREGNGSIFKIVYSCNPKILLMALSVLCMILVLAVPTFEVSMLEWMKIPPLSLVRYISALFLTSFLPGYLILKSVDRKGEIKGCATIVLSYLLSLFLSFIAGFLILLSSNSINVLGSPVIVVINLILLAVYYFTSRKVDEHRSLTLNSFELGIILPAFVEIILGSLIVMLSNMPLTSGDMRQHYGFALQFSQRFPIYAGKMIAYSGGYLFHVYLAVLFSLSGIPPALAEQGLYLTSFMLVLAFYSAMEAWFPERGEKTPIVATFLSILLGFGGLYVLYLKYMQPASSITQLLNVATYKTYDIYMRILLLPDIVAPTWDIGLPVFLMLLYFLRKDTCSYTKRVIVPILIALGWLGHIAEPIIFIFILLVYALFFRRSGEGKFGPYVMLGLFLVAIVDLTAPAQIYLRSVKEAFSTPFFTSLSLSMLITIIEMMEDKLMVNFSTNIKNFVLKKLEVVWRFGRWILLYAYVFSFIVWLAVEKNFNLWEWGGYSSVPFFVFPLRFGAVGLLAVISVFLYFTKIVRDRVLLFFLMFIPLGFILEQAASYGLLPYYPAYRYATLTFVGALVIAAFGIINLMKSASKSIRLTVVLCTVLMILMISSQLSTSLYYVNASYYSKYAKISQDELDALDYIRQHLSQNSSVLTFTTDSAKKLRNFAGVNAVQDAQRWSNLILSTSNPYIITYVLGSSNIKYIYVSQKDAELIRSNRILTSMINYFPKVLENNYVTIYEVPSLTPPSSNASLGILHISPSIQPEDNAWIEDSFTEGWHPHRQYGKIKSYESEAKNGVLTISVTSNQSGNVWVSYAYSGLKLNTSVHSVLAFRYRVENNLTWFTLQLWNSSNKVFFYVGHQTDREFTTKTFTLAENQTITRIEVIVETVKEAPANTTARAYVDYIKFSPPSLSWKDDTFLKDWTFYEKYGNVTDWKTQSNGDILKINVTTGQEGTVWVSYSLPLAIKTKNSILSFRYRVANEYTWFTVILQNATDRFFFYEGHLTDRTFTTKSFLLPDNQTITRVEVIVETTGKAPAGTSAIAYLDYIEITQRPFDGNDAFPALLSASLQSKYSFLYVDDILPKNLDLSYYTHVILTSDPKTSIGSLLGWISEGNSLVVLNTHGNGFFADLLGINNSSPLISVRNYGLGKVIYINLEKVDRKSDVTKQELIGEVRQALALYEYPRKVDVLPVYNSTSGDIKIDGDLNLLTDALELQGSATLTGSPFQLNGSTEIGIYGKVTLTIKNASLLISPSESYLIIKPESYPLEGEVVIEGHNALIIVGKNVIYNLSTPVNFKFRSENISLNARLPMVNASGTITFDKLDVHGALYVPLAGIVQQKAKVEGKVKFDTAYISSPLIIFSMFKADGKIINLDAITPSKLTIPWSEVLSSSYTIIFNIIFFSSVIFYAFKKRVAKQNIKEEGNGN